MSFLVLVRFFLEMKDQEGKGLSPKVIRGGLGLMQDSTFSTRLCSVRARGWDLVQRVRRGIWGQANEYFLRVQRTAIEVPQHVCCPGDLEKAAGYLRTRSF